MEGRVYVVAWKKTADGYRLWVKGRPKIVAERSTFEDAADELSRAICTATGDGEGIHEYDPPRPLSGTFAGPHARTRLAAILIHESTTVVNVRELHTEWICPRCRYVRGARTDATATLARIESGLDAVAARLRSRTSRTPELSVFSAEFRTLLTTDEDIAFE